MRNIDYRALYEQVVKNQDATDPKKRRGTYDNLTHDQRTQKAIDGNVARSMSVKLRDKGMGTGKKGVSPVEPANLKVVDEAFQETCQTLIDEGFCKDLDDVYRLIDVLEQTKTVPNPSVAMPMNTAPKGVKSNMPIIPQNKPKTFTKPGSPKVKDVPLT